MCCPFSVIICFTDWAACRIKSIKYKAIRETGASCYKMLCGFCYANILCIEITTMHNVSNAIGF
jgi:hypothetical protein